MPMLNGIEATRALKTLMPMVPVIIFSNNSAVLSEKEVLSAGITALIPKSENMSVLIDRVRALLHTSAARFGCFSFCTERCKSL
jgi:DNA-binding NarL/FixJ family response regulator